MNAPHSLNKHNYIWVNLHEIVNTHLLLELVSPVAQADGKFFMSTQMTWPSCLHIPVAWDYGNEEPLHPAAVILSIGFGPSSLTDVCTT